MLVTPLWQLMRQYDWRRAAHNQVCVRSSELFILNLWIPKRDRQSSNHSTNTELTAGHNGLLWQSMADRCYSEYILFTAKKLIGQCLVMHLDLDVNYSLTDTRSRRQSTHATDAADDNRRGRRRILFLKLRSFQSCLLSLILIRVSRLMSICGIWSFLSLVCLVNFFYCQCLFIFFFLKTFAFSLKSLWFWNLVLSGNCLIPCAMNVRVN